MHKISTATQGIHFAEWLWDGVEVQVFLVHDCGLMHIYCGDTTPMFVRLRVRSLHSRPPRSSGCPRSLGSSRRRQYRGSCLGQTGMICRCLPPIWCCLHLFSAVGHTRPEGSVHGHSQITAYVPLASAECTSFWVGVRGVHQMWLRRGLCYSGNGSLLSTIVCHVSRGHVCGVVRSQ